MNRGTLIRAGAVAFALVVGLFFFELFAPGSWTLYPHWYTSNPRMYVQPSIRTYQAAMPHPPAGSVPRTDAIEPLPTTQQARTLTTRPTTFADLAAGKTCYQYYCVFCHGDAGDGNGPVGESYVPKPADLRTPRVREMSDGQLLRAMITGTGHEPVLEYTVLPEHRWPLVHYVRELSGKP